MEKPKISFGFKKLSKPSLLPNASIKPKETVQFIDCLEDKNIKILNEVVEVKKELVIPMKPSAPVSDVKHRIKQAAEKNSEIKSENLSLEQRAAKELIEESVKGEGEESETNSHIVPLATNPPTGEKESTLDDYENVPIEKFGLAMLRGMGWEPGKGIGKNGKIAAPIAQVLRPKGMGLGADNAMKADQSSKVNKDELKLVKGSYVRLTGGVHKDSYGQVEGFDDDNGRVFIKLAQGGDKITIGEFMIQVVSASEYSKNSNVSKKKTIYLN